MLAHLAGVGMLHSLEAHIVDVGVREVVARVGQADVQLAWQVGQLRVAVTVVGVHGIDACTPVRVRPQLPWYSRWDRCKQLAWQCLVACVFVILLRCIRDEDSASRRATTAEDSRGGQGCRQFEAQLRPRMKWIGRTGSNITQEHMYARGVRTMHQRPHVQQLMGVDARDGAAGDVAHVVHSAHDAAGKVTGLQFKRWVALSQQLLWSRRAVGTTGAAGRAAGC